MNTLNLFFHTNKLRTHIWFQFWSYRAPYFFEGVLFDPNVWSLFPDKLVVFLLLRFVVIAVFVIVFSLFIVWQLCKICVRWQCRRSRKALYIDNWLNSILTLVIKVKLLAWSRKLILFFTIRIIPGAWLSFRFPRGLFLIHQWCFPSLKIIEVFDRTLVHFIFGSRGSILFEIIWRQIIAIVILLVLEYLRWDRLICRQLPSLPIPVNCLIVRAHVVL